jgi:hypothetical protein
MRRLILTHERLLDVPDGLNHAEFVRQDEPDGRRLRHHGDIVLVHLEALLDRDAEKVEPAVQAASADLFTLAGIHKGHPWTTSPGPT